MANNAGQGGNFIAYPTEDAHIFNAAGAVIWTAAAVPVGKTLTGVSFTVVTTDAANRIVDSDGTTVIGVPAGYSNSWHVLGGGSQNPPQQINAGPAGRIIVSFQCK